MRDWRKKREDARIRTLAAGKMDQSGLAAEEGQNPLPPRDTIFSPSPQPLDLAPKTVMEAISSPPTTTLSSPPPSMIPLPQSSSVPDMVVPYRCDTQDCTVCPRPSSSSSSSATTPAVAVSDGGGTFVPLQTRSTPSIHQEPEQPSSSRETTQEHQEHLRLPTTVVSPSSSMMEENSTAGAQQFSQTYQQQEVIYLMLSNLLAIQTFSRSARSFV